ncbi:MAG: hypothetical protein K2G23_04405 [Muribaculaceae bacterium]|nr:hypothetical protein [Muribaculaceae bacterium]
MAKEQMEACPYCKSYNIKQDTSNFAKRTATRTVGVALGFGLSLAGHVFTLGRAGDKIANFCASNVVDPITDIVERKYICKNCGRVF